MSTAERLDMSTNISAVVSASIGKVWPLLLDQAAWMTEFKLETVSRSHSLPEDHFPKFQLGRKSPSRSVPTGGVTSVAHYHEERNHQGRDNQLIEGRKEIVGGP